MPIGLVNNQWWCNIGRSWINSVGVALGDLGAEFAPLRDIDWVWVLILLD
jgi:hypothetical protein